MNEEDVEVLWTTGPACHAPFTYAGRFIDALAGQAVTTTVGDRNRLCVARVTFSANVTLEERHRVMRDLCDMARIRYGDE